MKNLLTALSAGVSAAWSELTAHEADAGVTASYKLIQAWYDLYRGHPDWQDYTFIDVNGHKQDRQRKLMNAAKIVTQELCSLIWTERPVMDIPAGVISFLEAQNFFRKSEEYSEYGAALGGYVYKLYADGEGENVRLNLDYIKADRFIPRSWTSAGITEADFIADYVYKNKTYTLIEEHRMPAPGQVVVTKRVCKNMRDGKFMDVNAESVGVDSRPVVIESPVPLFAYVRYPGANNLQPDTPLGLSMYANAADSVETLDYAFDNLQHEIKTSRRKIILPAEMLKTYYTPQGKDKQYYDANEEVYVAFNETDKANMTPTPIDFDLRIESISQAIQTALDILSVQVGFSAGYLTFNRQTQAITATQVVSENSKTFKTKVKYENAIDDGIKTLITAIQAIGPQYGLMDTEGTVNVQWNDNVIEDRDAKTDYWIKRFEAGTCTLTDVLVHVDGMEPEEAATRAAEIKAESATVDVGAMFGGNDGAE